MLNSGPDRKLLSNRGAAKAHLTYLNHNIIYLSSCRAYIDWLYQMNTEILENVANATGEVYTTGKKYTGMKSG